MKKTIAIALSTLILFSASCGVYKIPPLPVPPPVPLETPLPVPVPQPTSQVDKITAVEDDNAKNIADVTLSFGGGNTIWLYIFEEEGQTKGGALITGDGNDLVAEVSRWNAVFAVFALLAVSDTIDDYTIVTSSNNTDTGILITKDKVFTPPGAIPLMPRSYSSVEEDTELSRLAIADIFELLQKQIDISDTVLATFLQELEEESEAILVQSSLPSWKPEGMYLVGKDIEAGEYVLRSTSLTSAYYAVKSDSTGSLSSIIANGNFHNTVYLTVSDGQYLEIKRAEFAIESAVPAATPVNGVLSEGIYKVGKDIEEGEYLLLSLNPDTRAYCAVLSDSTGAHGTIVTNDNFKGNKYITVKNGQYLEFSRAELLVE